MSKEATRAVDPAATEPPPLALRNPPLAALLAWLVPGLGHAYQGRYAKAALFAVCILGLFFWGQHMALGKAVYFQWDREEWRAQYLGQLGVGLFSLPALIPDRYRAFLPPAIANYGARPSAMELDDLHRDAGRMIHLAVVFTVVAGLLNILVIFDALDGPGNYALERRYKRELAEQKRKQAAEADPLSAAEGSDDLTAAPAPPAARSPAGDPAP